MNDVCFVAESLIYIRPCVLMVIVSALWIVQITCTLPTDLEEKFKIKTFLVGNWIGNSIKIILCILPVESNFVFIVVFGPLVTQFATA